MKKKDSNCGKNVKRSCSVGRTTNETAFNTRNWFTGSGSTWTFHFWTITLKEAVVSAYLVVMETELHPFRKLWLDRRTRWPPVVAAQVCWLFLFIFLWVADLFSHERVHYSEDEGDEGRGGGKCSPPSSPVSPWLRCMCLLPDCFVHSSARV